ncbi:uncharacterized protein LOC128559709 [Mercenaria mercenaria]|uniref:uncharacterized protein LOC128559709 n=1 Tax=Mercenaria mercenaria TaxID=6596 RepID=UPI00234E9C91|nr:uncharacterized protein LOC128559709 [Mercenaria mercenaria]
MPNTYNLGQPCAYGGLIYAYNETSVRIWRPDHATGAAICISDSMGFGINSQASQNGQLVFRVYQPPSFKKAEEYEPMKLVCSHFAMLGNDTAYNSTPIASQQNITTLISCDYSCRQHSTCVTYSFSNDTCHMYNTSDNTLLFTKSDSQVWTLKARVVNVEEEP